MKLIIAADYDEMSRLAADKIAACLKAKPDCVLGLATGSTPIGLYAQLVKDCAAGDISFAVKNVFMISIRNRHKLHGRINLFVLFEDGRQASPRNIHRNSEMDRKRNASACAAGALQTIKACRKARHGRQDRDSLLRKLGRSAEMIDQFESELILKPAQQS